MVKMYSLFPCLGRCVATLKDAFFVRLFMGRIFYSRGIEMKKLLTILSFSVLLVLFVFGLGACDDEKDLQANNISFKTLTVGGDTVYGKVSNATTEFSFLEEISCTDSTQYVVSLDSYGVHTVVTKTVPLIEGDNVFYVIETNGDNIKTYTVTIRRRSIYTVSFQANGGNNIESQLVEEDSFAYEPTTVRAGYSFNGWDYDFNTPITKNEHITANWVANTNTSYKVEYYHQNIYDDNYTLFETVTDTGTTDNEVTAEIKEYDHFTYNENRSFVIGNISGNGDTILKVYYTRNTYALSINNTTLGAITNAGIYKYGTFIESTVDVNKLGYQFEGWYNGNNILCLSKTYSFTIEFNVVAKIELKDEMKNFNFTSSDKTCFITSIKDKNVSQISIPDYVTTVSYDLFWDCTNIEKIFLGDGITYITELFNNCFNLTNIQIGNYVTYIDEDAFLDCVKLQYNEYSDAYYLGNDSNPYVFLIKSKNRNITSCEINKKTKTIGPYAFYRCVNLNNVNIPSNVISIGEYAFADCENLNTANIPNNVISIGTYAFYNCKALQELTIGNNVEKIGDCAFEYCRTLINVNIPNSVTSMGRWTFFGCDNLEEVTIGNGLTHIGDYTFKFCPNLKSVTIGEAVTVIGEDAFYGCSSLSSIIIPYNVNRIDAEAFKECENLTSVLFKNSSGWKGYVSSTSPHAMLSGTPSATQLKSTHSGYYWRREA